jgi:hypothetical protein
VNFPHQIEVVSAVDRLALGSREVRWRAPQTEGTRSFVQYSESNRHKTRAHIKQMVLPRNLSQLNDYMCSPLNRKGHLCSECADGFGPSVTSYGYTCVNCTGAWYRDVPLFLLLELTPITILSTDYSNISNQCYFSSNALPHHAVPIHCYILQL